MGTTSSNAHGGGGTVPQQPQDLSTGATASANTVDGTNDPFPEDGIRLSYLTEFISHVCGGRHNIETLTTTDICEKYVKPRTKDRKISYVELLKEEDAKNEQEKQKQQQQQGGGGTGSLNNAPIAKIVGKAEVFISHAWKYKFVDVVDALQDHFRDKPDIFIWFDNFTVNQHKNDDKKFIWWSTTFKDAIQNFGHTVMVLAPWRCPIPLTRAWCLWELYCASTTNTKFEVAMSQKEQDDFFKELANDPDIPVDRMLSAIDVKNADAFKESDKENIFEAVARISGEFTKEDEALPDGLEKEAKKRLARTKGCEILNAVVFRRMREWVIEVSERRLATRRFTAGQRLEDKLVLGSIYHNHGRYEKAEPILIECTEYFRRGNYGEDHYNRFVAMNYLAALHGKKNRHNKAEPLLKTALEKKRSLADPNDVTHKAHIVKAHYELGKYYEMRRMYPLAWEQYHHGLKQCEEGLTKFPETFPQEHLLTGMNHLNRLTIIDPPPTILAKIMDFQMKVDSDFLYIRDIVNRMKDKMNHEETPSEESKRKWSDNHPLIVHAFLNKARCADFISRQDNTEEIGKKLENAAEFYFEALKRCKELLGNRHPETVKLLRIMSKFFNHAENIFDTVLKESEKALEAQQLSNFYFQDYRSKL